VECTVAEDGINMTDHAQILACTDSRNRTTAIEILASC
jgi:hypothetical protein